MQNRLLIFLYLAPVQNDNKPMTQEDKKRNRIKSMVVFFVECVVISYLCYQEIAIAGVVANTLVLVSVLMIVAKIKGGDRA